MRLLAFTALVACGCGGPLHDDHVELRHDEVCLSGCPSASSEVRGDRIAAGARYVVEVDNADRLAAFTVSTSDDSVLSIASATSGEGDAEHPDRLVLEAGAPGAARLIFGDDAGELIDEVEVVVVEAASLAHFRQPEQPVRLMVGGSELFYVEVHDEAGQRLLGYGAVEYMASAVTIQDARAQATMWEDGIGQPVAWPESVGVTANLPGVTTIEARAGDASLAFDIEVVDGSAVSRIQLGVECELFDCSRRTVRAHAFTADGDEIHDPECEWSWPSDVPDWEVSAGRSSISFTGEDDVPSFEVTCTIGEVSASTWL